MKIQSQDKSVGDILQAGYYRIPRFQRPYSWTKENVEELITDILNGNSSDYFIGSIVVFKDSAKRFGIVDGQQRMMTITMILCAIRDAFIREGEEDLAKGIHLYIEKNNLENKPEFIVFSDTSYPYFHEVIQSYAKEGDNIEINIGDEEKCIADAFLIINKAIEKKIDPAKKESKKKAIKFLEEIRDIVLNLNIIFIEVGNEDDSYLIFETLNTRGKDLAVTDLIKDFLARNIKEKSTKVDRFKDRWNVVIKIIEESPDISSDNFFLHFWLSRFDYITLKKLYKSIKKTIKPESAQHFLKNIEKDVQLYRAAVEPDYRSWQKTEEQIKNSLLALNLFKVKQPLPYILGILREYTDKKISKGTTEKALKTLENFHFQFSAITSHRSSGGLSTLYASKAVALSKAKNTQEAAKIINETRGKLKNKKLTLEEFEIDFTDLKFSKEFSKQKNIIKYILSEIDKNMSTSGRLTDYRNMTIEHIAPQNGSGSSFSNLDIANIGNLILIDEETNQKLENKTFDEKKKILSSKNIWLDDVLKKASTWNPEIIAKRSKLLAKIAYEKIWKI